MNVRSITSAAGATLASLVVATASAQAVKSGPAPAVDPPVSRASVVAEARLALAAAGAAGHRPEGEATSDDWMNVASTTTRAQVRAELRVARQSGEFDRIQAEAASFDVLPSPVRLAGSAH